MYSLHPVYQQVYFNDYVLMECLVSPCNSQSRVQTQPEKGVWDMRGKQFHKGVQIQTWALIIFAQYRQCSEDKIRCSQGVCHWGLGWISVHGSMYWYMHLTGSSLHTFSLCIPALQIGTGNFTFNAAPSVRNPQSMHSFTVSRSTAFECTLCASPCRNFVWQLRKISNDAGMPFRSDPFFNRYVNGVDNVEPLFRQLKQDRMDLQLIMVVLPGKTPVYG